MAARNQHAEYFSWRNFVSQTFPSWVLLKKIRKIIVSSWLEYNSLRECFDVRVSDEKYSAYWVLSVRIRYLQFWARRWGCEPIWRGAPILKFGNSSWYPPVPSSSLNLITSLKAKSSLRITASVTKRELRELWNQLESCYENGTHLWQLLEDWKHRI